MKLIFKKGNLIDTGYNDFLKTLDMNNKIVFTNGVFDLLHAGHIRYLKNASDNGDFLIVGVNSNVSVNKLNKVGKRPIIDELERAEILSCLFFVDIVIIFDETTPAKLIKSIKPNIYVKGGDYEIDNLPETKVVESYGGKVIKGIFVEGKSSTVIISKINSTI
jgi:D-glycero-beta-D-manno-heptose 1-phosphate adenylyltransferase